MIMARRRYMPRRLRRRSLRGGVQRLLLKGIVLLIVAGGGLTWITQDLQDWPGVASRDVVLASSIYVIDGDTIDIGGTRYRLLGYDTAETVQAECDAERALGYAATDRLRMLVAIGGHIELARRARRDQYGRILARLYVDGRDVRGILIEEGLARAYDRGPRQGWC